jgi:hypothetical protein
MEQRSTEGVPGEGRQQALSWQAPCRTSVGAADRGGVPILALADERQHLLLGQSLAIRPATPLPGPIAADADVEHVALLGPGKRFYLLGHPGDLLGRVGLFRYLHFLPSNYEYVHTLCLDATMLDLFLTTLIREVRTSHHIFRRRILK